jgi:hypothetical protein
MEGDREREADIHGRFAHLRLGRTEQFRPGADLMAFIGRPLLVNPDPDAVEIHPNRPLKTRAAKLDAGLLRRAKTIADDKGLDLSEYLTGILRPAVNRDWAKFAKKIIEEQEGGEE